MALDPRIMKMVADAKTANNSHDTPDLMASVLDDLVELGLEKATKRDLRRIVIRAVSRDAALRSEVLEGLDSLT